jgi:hypothetical protein
MSVEQPTAVIIGAMPAGLTTVDEFLSRTDIHPSRADKSDLWEVNTEQGHHENKDN